MDKAPEKKKGLAAMIVASMGKPSASGSSSSPDEEAGEDSVTAAQEVLDAIKAGDAKALDQALSAHYKLCESDEGPAEESDEGEPPQ